MSKSSPLFLCSSLYHSQPWELLLIGCQGPLGNLQPCVTPADLQPQLNSPPQGLLQVTLPEHCPFHNPGTSVWGQAWQTNARVILVPQHKLTQWFIQAVNDSGFPCIHE